MASGSINTIDKYSQIQNNVSTTAAGNVLDARQGKALNDRITNITPKSKSYNFTNLKQYSPTSYYLLIPTIKSKLGITSSSLLIAASIIGWANIGGNIINIGLTDDQLYVFYINNATINTDSRITVRFIYI